MMNYEHLDQGRRHSTPIEHSKRLHCERCNVSWIGCWDESDCEFCGRNCLTGVDHLENKDGLTSRIKNNE